jgi:hypothetical protein
MAVADRQKAFPEGTEINDIYLHLACVSWQNTNSNLSLELC